MNKAKVRYICTQYTKHRFHIEGFKESHWWDENDVIKAGVVTREELHEAYNRQELGFVRLAPGIRWLYIFEFQTWMQKRLEDG
jgi:hypothetical protein